MDAKVHNSRVLVNRYGLGTHLAPPRADGQGAIGATAENRPSASFDSTGRQRGATLSAAARLAPLRWQRDGKGGRQSGPGSWPMSTAGRSRAVDARVNDVPGATEASKNPQLRK